PERLETFLQIHRASGGTARNRSDRIHFDTKTLHERPRLRMREPGASWLTSNFTVAMPRASMTHTAWVRLAQSSPAKRLVMDKLLLVAV
ncbi:MAG: hypothetical protein ACHP7E_01035, partial [Burkholderiales bacterium]